MILNFLPYKFEPCINNYKNELTFLGETYYDKYFVFDHTKKLLDKVLGFPINKIELAFKADVLVGVWLFTEEKSIDDLVVVFETYFAQKATVKLNNQIVSECFNTEYYWQSELFIVVIENNTYQDKIFVYIATKNHSLYSFDD